MMSPSTNTNQRYTSRTASILICVLVCLVVATALVTSTVRTALNARRAMRTQHQLRQTELLLAAGIQRAALQLQANVDYTGETWDLSPQVISGVEAAQVNIDISSAPGDSRDKVHVTARLSVAAHTAIQRSYSFTVDPQ